MPPILSSSCPSRLAWLHSYSPSHPNQSVEIFSQINCRFNQKYFTIPIFRAAQSSVHTNRAFNFRTFPHENIVNRPPSPSNASSLLSNFRLFRVSIRHWLLIDSRVSLRPKSPSSAQQSALLGKNLIERFLNGNSCELLQFGG